MPLSGRPDKSHLWTDASACGGPLRATCGRAPRTEAHNGPTSDTPAGFSSPSCVGLNGCRYELRYVAPPIIWRPHGDWRLLRNRRFAIRLLRPSPPDLWSGSANPCGVLIPELRRPQWVPVRTTLCCFANLLASPRGLAIAAQSSLRDPPAAALSARPAVGLRVPRPETGRHQTPLRGSHPRGGVVSMGADANYDVRLRQFIWRPHGDSNPGSHRERVVS